MHASTAAQHYLMSGATRRGFRVPKQDRKKRNGGFNHLPVAMRGAAKLGLFKRDLLVFEAPNRMEKPCRHCSKGMLVAQGQFARLHGHCRGIFRRIHGSVSLQGRAVKG